MVTPSELALLLHICVKWGMRGSGSFFKPVWLYPILAFLGLLPVLPILIKGSPILNNDMLVAYFCYFWDFHKNWSWSHPLVFWSSSYQCGMPMHAYWQSGYLYPITWLFFGPLNPLYGIYLFYSFHFSLGIFGFLKLGPYLRLHKPAALWAGLCFSLSGTMLARYEHATFLSGWTWMPLVLAAYFALRDRPSLKTLFLYSLSVALQALGGHPQASITTAMLVAVFTVADLLRRKPTKVVASTIALNPQATPNSNIVLPKHRAAWIISGHVLAILYCAPMLIPFLHLVDETSRYDGVDWEGGKAPEASAATKLESGVFGFEKFSTGGMRPIHLLSLAIPNILGSPSNASWWGGEVWGEVFVYLGGLGLFFCFFASWKRAGRDMRILWIIGLVGLWIAFGKHLGASQLLYHTPVLNNFRRPARFVILFVMAIAAGSGYGLQAWLARPRGRRIAGWVAIGSIVAAAAFLAIRLFPGITDSALALVGKYKHLDPNKDYGDKVGLLLGRGALDFLFIAISGWVVWFCVRRPRARMAILFTVLLADLLRLHWDHFYLFRADYYRKPPETVQVLDQATAPFWRVSHYLEYPGLELWQMHNDPVAHFGLLEREKSALTFGIHAIFGYRHVSAHLPLIWNWEPGLTPASKGTRYLFSNRELLAYRGDSLKALGSYRGVNSYELTDWRPRIEQVPHGDTASATCPVGYSGYHGLCVQEIRDGKIRVTGVFQAGDNLLVRERAYRGWQYRVDGGAWIKAPESKDHFLALLFADKASVVDLEFFPTDFYWLVGMCFLVSGLILVFFWVFRKR